MNRAWPETILFSQARNPSEMAGKRASQKVNRQGVLAKGAKITEGVSWLQNGCLTNMKGNICTKLRMSEGEAMYIETRMCRRP
jgi:hypothetical protein